MEILIDAKAILADGLDSAIIGHTMGSEIVAVYNYEKCIEILMQDNEWTHEEAAEWMDFNVVSSYVGNRTPIFISQG